MKGIPCPCCGSVRIYAGPTGNGQQGVSCQGCGLTIERDLPDEFPESSLGMDGPAALRECERVALEHALAAWNRRATDQSAPKRSAGTYHIDAVPDATYSGESDPLKVEVRPVAHTSSVASIQALLSEWKERDNPFPSERIADAVAAEVSRVRHAVAGIVNGAMARARNGEEVFALDVADRVIAAATHGEG